MVLSSWQLRKYYEISHADIWDFHYNVWLWDTMILDVILWLGEKESGCQMRISVNIKNWFLDLIRNLLCQNKFLDHVKQSVVAWNIKFLYKFLQQFRCICSCHINCPSYEICTELYEWRHPRLIKCVFQLLCHVFAFSINFNKYIASLSTYQSESNERWDSRRGRGWEPKVRVTWNIINLEF
jgi:hypothetical protein